MPDLDDCGVVCCRLALHFLSVYGQQQADQVWSLNPAKVAFLTCKILETCKQIWLLLQLIKHGPFLMIWVHLAHQVHFPAY